MNINRVAIIIALVVFCSAFNAGASSENSENIKHVKIGKQTWMADNLGVTAFRNGDVIADTPDAKSWMKANARELPAFSAYENSSNNREKWGLLYNYFAVSDPRGLCPLGWRIPNNKDWSELENQLGKGTASFKMKSKAGWIDNGNGSDESGFNGLPGGFRIQNGDFRLGLRVAYWWSESEDDMKQVTSILLFDYDKQIFRIQYPKQLGQSVRCIAAK